VLFGYLDHDRTTLTFILHFWLSLCLCLDLCLFVDAFSSLQAQLEELHAVESKLDDDIGLMQRSMQATVSLTNPQHAYVAYSDITDSAGDKSSKFVWIAVKAPKGTLFGMIVMLLHLSTLARLV
jgi:hypothetical protein